MFLYYLHLQSRLYSIFICICFYRKKTHIFEEFLFTWQERLRKLEQPTTMSVKLQAEVDKYKVPTHTDVYYLLH